MRTDRHRIQISLHCIIYRANSGLPVYNPNLEREAVEEEYVAKTNTK
jgi:hypothetical protein